MKFYQLLLVVVFQAGVPASVSAGFPCGCIPLPGGREAPPEATPAAEESADPAQVEREEAAIQNNLLLRSFFEWRCRLIFERSGPDTWSYEVSTWDKSMVPGRGILNSGQRIFMDNYVSHQIEAFSRELRGSLDLLEESGIRAEQLGSSPQDSAAAGKLPETLREIADAASSLRAKLRLILPHFGGRGVAGIPDVPVPEGGRAGRIKELNERIGQCARGIRAYFYSSEHTVSVGNLVEGDFLGELKLIEEEAEREL